MRFVDIITGFSRKYPGCMIAAGFFLALEIALRLLPMEYTMGAGVFLTKHRRDRAESAGPTADYIILGDSRSLSLYGRAASPEAPYSVYNFSLPAMSPRYFSYFLRKIVAHRAPGERPAAVIFAGDPGLFQASWTYPYHDREGLYSSGINDSLATYLWNRFWIRLRRLTLADNRPAAPPENTLLWETFSHRFLHLFSMGELSGMFTGAERVFMLREALPLEYRTYKWREGLRQYTFGLRGDYLLPFQFPENCSSCAALLTERCHPEVPRIQDNLFLERALERQGGGFNLANRLDPVERFQYLAGRDLHVERQARLFDSISPDFFAVEALIAEARRLNLKIVFADVPSMDVYRGTRFHREYFAGLEKLAARDPGGILVLRFPEPYYPRELFVEQVHYECAGGERLNREFYADVMPRVIKFAPPRGAP